MGRGTRERHSGTRYILTRVGSSIVAFPIELVGEIVSVDRSALLSLPFYSRRCLGVVHYRGQLIPLCALSPEVALPERSAQGALTAIRLSSRAGSRIGVGVCVDKILEQVSESELNRTDRIDPDSRDTACLDTNSSETVGSNLDSPATDTLDNSLDNSAVALENLPTLPLHMFSLDDVPDGLWLPRRSLIGPLLAGSNSTQLPPQPS